MAGLLPMALLCAALGVALGFAPRRAAWQGAGAFVLVAIPAGMVAMPAGWRDGIFLGLWVSTILTALLVYLPHGPSRRLAITAGANGGLWAGAVAAVTAAGLRDLAVAAPVVLILVPAAWLVARGYGVAVRVLASWIVAVGILAGFVSLTPTPGYKADHME